MELNWTAQRDDLSHRDSSELENISIRDARHIKEQAPKREEFETFEREDKQL